MKPDTDGSYNSSLLSSPAPVDDQGCTRHETGCLRGEENDYSPELLWSTPPAQRDVIEKEGDGKSTMVGTGPFILDSFTRHGGLEALLNFRLHFFETGPLLHADNVIAILGLHRLGDVQA